jgi:hypothetical protein
MSRLLSLFPLSLFTKSTTRMASSVPPSQVATFAAGCFWGVEHIFLVQWPIKQDKGILKTAVGYTGGRSENPTYNQVCSGSTNHAEALRIEFDPSKVTYEELVGLSCYSVSWCLSSVTRLDLKSISIAHTTPQLLIHKARTTALVRLTLRPCLRCLNSSRIPLCHILQYPRARGHCPSRDRGSTREALYA